MSFFRVAYSARLAAFLAVLVFAGDIITDSIADTSEGHCVSQTSQSDSSHEKAPCPHCSCAVHMGAVVVADYAVQLTSGIEPATLLRISDESTPPRLAVSIDHPPQLA
jgi:hypothetical protein